jgi:hypothetical protein
VFAGAAALFALWAALFATRADFAVRRARALADQRWQATVRPQPSLTFLGPPALTQPLDVSIRNFGGALTAGAVVVQYGEDLFGAEIALAEKAPPQTVALRPLIKAWRSERSPRCLLLAGRDIEGRCWDFVGDGRPIKNPGRWLDRRLRDLKLAGIADFPELRANP